MRTADLQQAIDVSLAVELFDWTYRRSIAKYQVILEAMGVPDPTRVRYREQLGQAMQQVVFFGSSFEDALAKVAIPGQDQAAFKAMLDEELKQLQPYNCARYRLPIGTTQEWIQRGRPR